MNRTRGLATTVALVFSGSVASMDSLPCQGPPVSVDQIARIFASGGDVAGWGEFDVPEFVAAAYGARARNAIVAILREASTPGNYHLQLEALTTAQYERVGVPVAVLLDYALGRRGQEVGGVLRQRAVAALAMRPDTGLRDFWLEIERDPDASIRQFAPAGLSCALGVAASPHLERLTADSDSGVGAVARFYRQQASTMGPSMKACGGRLRRVEAMIFPVVIRASLMERGAVILKEIP